jgi:hypothetical protein
MIWLQSMNGENDGPVAVADKPDSIITAPTSDRAPRERLAYFDNLRTALTGFVVVHHAAVGYSHIPMWYYNEPPTDAFARLQAIAVAKFAIVAALGLPLCWAFAYLVHSLPYAKRVL